MRYLPLNAKDRAEMLARVGVASIDTLFADIPAHKRLDHDLDLPARKTEMDVERLLSGLAAKNVAAGSVPFFVGAGAYKHHVPASVDHLIQRSEFLTSYTPYQPEIAQGTLQTIFEFQTQVAALTATDVANASMYDGSTATVEAVAMARRITGRSKAILSGGLHPHYAEAVRTVSTMAGEETEVLAPDVFAAEDLCSLIDADTSCVVVQNPDFFGNLRDLSAIAAACKTKGALLVGAFTEAVSLGLVQPPGAMGADIVAGEGQSIGNRLNFGGPYVGLFATENKISAADAGTPLRANRGCLRAAWLRLDALDAGAAYSARQGDIEYLHQFRPRQPRLFDSHDPAWRCWIAASRQDQSRPCGRSRGSARGGSRRAGAEQNVLQRIHNQDFGRRRTSNRADG